MSKIEIVINGLKERGISFKRDVCLARMTSFGIGGPAELLVLPATPEDLVKSLEILSQEDFEIFVIGRGTNILAADDGFKGAILKIENYDISHLCEGRFEAGAGLMLDEIIDFTTNKGFADGADLAGIPGSVGGAIAMNAGAWGMHISKVLENVVAFDLTGNEISIDLKKDFDYRFFKKRGRTAIFSAILKFSVENDPMVIDEEVKNNLTKRAQNQPISEKSAGCIFKNPMNEHAGRLIDQAGLKGTTIGGARVSDIHANFIVNKGDAKASDVLELIEKIRKTVLEKFGVELELEIIKLGFSE